MAAKTLFFSWIIESVFVPDSCSVKVFLKILHISQESTCVDFLIKFRSSYRRCSIKMGLQHRCFPVNIVKFLRTPFSQYISGRLLLRVEGLQASSFIKKRLVIYKFFEEHLFWRTSANDCFWNLFFYLDCPSW